MVHCGVTPPYLSPAHPEKGEKSSRGHGYCNALGGYTRRGKYIATLEQVQSQLANLTMQLQDMAKTKVMYEHVCCTTCRDEGNRRDVCPLLGNYVADECIVHFQLGLRRNGVNL
jgi:hypothetical protein